MSQEDEAYALAHFGVKGMKWGVRKQHPTSDKPSGPLTIHQKRILAVGGAATAAATVASLGNPLVLAAGTVATGAAYAHSRRTDSVSSLSSQGAGEAWVKQHVK